MGWSNTSVMAAALQAFGRLVFGMITINLAPMDCASVFFTLLVFSIAESNRYPYYYLKQIGMEHSQVGRIFGWLRYSTFLVIYPLGAIGELMTSFASIDNIRATSPKRFSIELPNTVNFAFHFDYFLMYFLPLMYIVFFPQNYMYMVSQRKRYMASLKKYDNKQTTDNKETIQKKVM